MIDSSILEWLLDCDISIQYQVYRDLLSIDKPDLKERISNEGWAAKFLSLRNDNGHWGLGFYQPKWISTHYTLVDLKNLSVSKTKTSKIRYMNLKIQPAKKADLKEIEGLLSSYQLPTIDIYESTVRLFVATYKDHPIGSIGIEKYNQIGLLRSLAVGSKFKNQKVGERLIQYLLDLCINEKIIELYLLTTTAEDYFDKFGFHKIDRNKVPEIIMQTREFKDICPLSAVVMQRKL